MKTTKRFSRIFAACLCASLLLVTCTEFLEESIDDGKVELLSPGADAETNVYAIDFLWEPLDHALQYRLQVAAPSFDSAPIFYADTTVDKPRFSISLQPGQYQWRVKALNGSSATAYTTHTFTIHEAALGTQIVLLDTPPDNFLTSRNRVDFGWQRIFSAQNYRLQVDTNGFTDETDILMDRVVDGEAFGFDVTEEAQYQWRVRAENDTAQSRWSAVRRFTYDLTPPNPPTLTVPVNNAQVSRPVTLQWSGDNNVASYRLYVYKSDSTLYNAEFPKRLETTTTVFEEGTRGERILWRVRATDRAGNESGYSAWRSFVILR